MHIGPPVISQEVAGTGGGRGLAQAARTLSMSIAAKVFVILADFQIPRKPRDKAETVRGAI